MVNGRITVEQMEWLQDRAEELGGNLSAALRQAITDARLLAMARALSARRIPTSGSRPTRTSGRDTISRVDYQRHSSL